MRRVDSDRYDVLEAIAVQAATVVELDGKSAKDFVEALDGVVQLDAMEPRP
jgi:hypothetical protein